VLRQCECGFLFFVQTQSLWQEAGAERKWGQSMQQAFFHCSTLFEIFDLGYCYLFHHNQHRLNAVWGYCRIQLTVNFRKPTKNPDFNCDCKSIWAFKFIRLKMLKEVLLPFITDSTKSVSSWQEPLLIVHLVLRIDPITQSAYFNGNIGMLHQRCFSLGFGCTNSKFQKQTETLTDIYI
jgi:hypothetical protein